LAVALNLLALSLAHQDRGTQTLCLLPHLGQLFTVRLLLCAHLFALLISLLPVAMELRLERRARLLRILLLLLDELRAQTHVLQLARQLPHLVALLALSLRDAGLERCLALLACVN